MVTIGDVYMFDTIAQEYYGPERVVVAVHALGETEARMALATMGYTECRLIESN